MAAVPKPSTCDDVLKKVQVVKKGELHDTRNTCIARRICSTGGPDLFVSLSEAGKTTIVNWFDRACGRPVYTTSTSVAAMAVGILILIIIIIIVICCCRQARV